MPGVTDAAASRSRRTLLAILTHRAAALPVALSLVLAADMAAGHAHAASAKDVRAKRQASLDYMLTIAAASNIASFRTSCAAGRSVAGTDRSRSLGLTNVPDAIDLCITALIRTGRDRTLGYLSNADGSVTPALALDTGFVAGYGKGGSASAMPTLDALRLKAEGCLAQAENDKDLCYSIGYAYGVRATSGETMQAR